MTESLGKSVGEWSANENVNFGGRLGGTSIPISKLCNDRSEEMVFDSNGDKLEFLKSCTEENPVVKEIKTFEEKQQEIIERLTNTTTSSPTTNTQNKLAEDSNTKYYIYGGVGLAVIVGAFLIFKKK